uniref:Probable methionine--tRNA ligase, mitochondrial n=1 Tax=Psilocybe cubensis TaxID=181762 RepID=A0A8H8CE42_PSICU
MQFLRCGRRRWRTITASYRTFSTNIHPVSSTSHTDKPFYITTPIFYPNASPHIGHLYTLVTGDVFARYQRQKGRDVRFLAGTDEHGLKIQKAARAHFNGQSGREKEFCDALSQRFRDLAESASISNTCFMRTSSEEHRRTVEHVWRSLCEKGFIYKSRYEGWYSITDECFYTDSQITYPTPSTPISIETGAAVEWASEENYMFKLSALRDALLQHYTSRPGSVYPEQYYDDVLGMLGDGQLLADISISRPRSRLEWGVQVPDDPEQTVYVWFDALLIYLTGAGYPWVTAQSRGGWPADIQVIGKDILRFHAIYLPAILLALSSSGTVVHLPKTLLTHAHWTSSQKKMSKSLGNVADPQEAMKKWGVDVVRFYMMRVGGRWRSDADWSAEQVDKHFREIKDQLGNYFMRVASPVLFKRSQGGEGPIHESIQQAFLEDMPDGVSAETDSGDWNAILLRHTLALNSKFEKNMDALEAGNALAEIMAVLKVANKVLNEIQPWAAETHPQLVHTTRVVGLETLRVVAHCLGPFMPSVAARLQETLGTVEYHEGIDREEAMRVFWMRWEKKPVKAFPLF